MDRGRAPTESGDHHEALVLPNESKELFGVHVSFANEHGGQRTAMLGAGLGAVFGFGDTEDFSLR